MRISTVIEQIDGVPHTAERYRQMGLPPFAPIPGVGKRPAPRVRDGVRALMHESVGRFRHEDIAQA